MTHPFAMGIHHITCRTTSSGVDNLEIITDSMAWFGGPNVEISIDKSTSYHGSILHLLSFKISNNKKIKEFFLRLSNEDKMELIETIESRIDENNCLHFRIGLDSLVGGQPTLISSSERCVKCVIKIEVYPGQKVKEQGISLLKDSISN